MPRFTQLPVFRPHRFSLLPGSAAQARGCRAAVAVLAAAGLTVAYAGTAQASPRASAASAQTQPLPIYLNTHYSFAQRAADLVSRMTLAEKVQQLHTNSAPAIPRLGVQEYTYWNEGQHGLNTLFNDTIKLASGTGSKQSMDPADGQKLLDGIAQIDAIFWETKKA